MIEAYGWIIVPLTVLALFLDELMEFAAYEKRRKAYTAKQPATES